MLIVSVISEKGGVGKTTTALSLAVAAGLDGKKAAVIDTDPQATASTWTDRREAEFPWVVTSPSARLRAAIEQARVQKVEFLVIDTPPHAGADAVEAARLANVVVIPVEPHAFAIETLAKMSDVLATAGNPPAFALITKAPVQGRDAEIAASHISSLGLNVCPHVIHVRAAHRHAGNSGQSASEFEPGGKAAEEIKQVYAYTCSQVGKKGASNGKVKSAAKRA